MENKSGDIHTDTDTDKDTDEDRDTATGKERGTNREQSNVTEAYLTLPFPLFSSDSSVCGFGGEVRNTYSR